MRAIILAAGRGSRLSPVTGTAPKCLVRVGDLTLLERQILTLRACGISSITVVAGWQAPSVAAVCHATADVVENTRFAETNSLYSLWLARPLLREGFVVLNGDVLFHPQMLADLLSARCENALLVSSPEPGEALGEEEMKVQVRAGRVVALSKQLSPLESDGENVGIAKFSPTGARQLVGCLDTIVTSGSVMDWLPRAFQEFATRHPLCAIGTRGYPWIEIDYPDDYRRAVSDVLPLIDAPVPPAASDAVPLADWRPRSGHV